VTLTPEQAEMRTVLRSFFAQVSSDEAVREAGDLAGGFDPAIWSRLAGMGMLGAHVPVEFGGGGAGFVELAILLEEAGRSLFGGPLLSSALLATTALLIADARGSKRLLSELSAGQLIGTVAPFPHDGESRGRVHASLRSGSWFLTGEAAFVLDGESADLILVFADTPAGPSLYRVTGGAAGLERTGMETLDLSRRHSRLTFEETPAQLVGGQGGGHEIASRLMDIGVALLAAEQLGVAERMLELTVSYASSREQFGQPIGSFQAVKHQCAEMLVEVELMRSITYYAVALAARGDEELPIASPAAAAFTGEACFRIVSRALHLHGGIGFTWEHPSHLFFRRAKADEVLFGDARFHRGVLSKRLIAYAKQV